MRASGWLRSGLVFLTLVQVIAGGWLLLLPRSFYDDIPWVALFPPYNEHLARDLGGLYLALAVVLGAAAVTMERRMVRTALAAYLVFSGSHLIFHATHVANFTVAAAITELLALAIAVTIPALLLILSQDPQRHRTLKHVE